MLALGALCDHVRGERQSVRMGVCSGYDFREAMRTMRSVKFAILGATLGLISQAALAFQETGAKGEAAADPILKVEDGKGINLSLPDRPARSTGPEIKIPGLGTIGALPKLDFGLELLYGANEPKGTPQLDKNDGGDLRARATVKYKFNN